MVEKRFEKLGMPDIERFENYLPTAFSSELTLLQKVNKIIFDLIETNKLTNEMVDYLNKFIETFDEKLYKTIDDVLKVWLNEGLLADVVREAINEEVIEARTDYLGHAYLNLKERLDFERKEIVTRLAQTTGYDITRPPAPIQPADPTGLRDTQPTMQALVNYLDSIGGGTIFAPKGNYKFESGVKWASNVSLIGTGFDSRFFHVGELFSLFYYLEGEASGSSNISDDVWLENCRFENFQIDGQGLTYPTEHADGKGLFFIYMKKARFKNLYIRNTIGTGLGCDFLIDTTIEDVIAENCGRNWSTGGVGQSGIGIGTASSEFEPVIIKNNFAYNCGNYGIFVESQEPPMGTKSKGAQIKDNFVFGNRIGIGNKGSGGTIIDGNEIVSNHIGIQLTQESFDDVVSNNKIYDNILEGIYIGGNYKGNVSIHDNEILRNGNRGIQTVTDDEIPLKNVFINNNRISEHGVEGIRFGRVIKNLTITNNTMLDNGKDGIGDKAKAIGFYRDVNGFNIANNMFSNNKWSGTQLQDITFGENTVADYGVISNNVTKKGGIVNNGTFNRVTDIGNTGTVYEQFGDGVIPTGGTYVQITFDEQFSKPPKEVSILKSSNENIWVNNITRFGFFARRELIGGESKFNYLARI